MGVAIATFGLLADWVTAAQNFVAIFVYVYVLVIFAYIITSFVRLPYSLNWLQKFLYDVCEPYLRLFRRVIPPLGPLDLSPIAAVFALYLLGMLVNALIGRVL